MEAAEFDDCVLYGGLSGVELDFAELDLTGGVSIRKIYAHLMTPHIMAFQRPEKPGGAYGGYWAAVSDGRPHDIHIELRLPNECGAKLDEKVKFAKTVVALLRLHASPQFGLPIISNVPIEEAAAHSKKHHFLPVEPAPPFFSVRLKGREILSKVHFGWTIDSLTDAIKLNKENEQFAFALSALDSWQTIRSGPLALVYIWAALENIFSPDKAPELKFRVAALIASYLEGPGEQRKQKFKDVGRLYDARSKAAHGSSTHDVDVLYGTYDLLRKVVMKMIAQKKVPSKSELENNLFGEGSPRLSEVVRA
jgi:hypothetical protein